MAGNFAKNVFLSKGDFFMSLLIGYEMEEGFYGLCCSKCNALIGAITIKEAQCLMRDGIEPLCFDCDPDEADSVPKHVVAIEDSFFVGIGNWIFLSEWLTDTVCPDRKDLRMSQISLTTYYDLKTGKAVQYTPLSGWSKSPQARTNVRAFSAYESEA